LFPSSTAHFFFVFCFSFENGAYIVEKNPILTCCDERSSRERRSGGIKS
jgi:hypothetical protein